MGLLRNLQPTWWFAAHLHTRFEACVRHDPAPETMTATSPPSSSSGHLPRADNPDEITIDDNEEEGVTSVAENSRSDAPSRGAMVPKVAESIPPPPPQNPDEITLDDEIEAVEPPPPPPPPLRETKFLALDKCLPHRQFLEASPPPGNAKTNQLTYFCPCDNHQVVDIPTQEQERGREAQTTRMQRYHANGTGCTHTSLPSSTSAPAATDGASTLASGSWYRPTRRVVRALVILMTAEIRVLRRWRRRRRLRLCLKWRMLSRND